MPASSYAQSTLDPAAQNFDIIVVFNVDISENFVRKAINSLEETCLKFLLCKYCPKGTVDHTELHLLLYKI